MPFRASAVVPAPSGQPQRALTARRRRGERGATLVEGALVAPLFFLLIFSILEFGLVFRQYLTMSTADRNGTRAASAAGNAAQADYVTLQAIKKSSVAIKPSEIKTIVIFKASGPKASITDDLLLQPCLTTSVAGLCNRYTVSDLSRPIGDFGNCAIGSTSPDRFWCPTSRVVAASGPPDYIGVYIATKYQAVTKIFGKSYDLSEQTVYRMEAQTR